MERGVGLLDRYVARKRKRQVSSSGESDAAPVPSTDLGQPVTKYQSHADGSSGDRAITIPDSPKLRPSIGPEPDWSESNEDDPAPRALQIIPPSYPGEGSQSRSKFMRSSANRLNDLYPDMYRVPVTALGMGLHETFNVPVPASTLKEDFLQIIDDGIQVRNHNFVQSTELVRWVFHSGGFSVVILLH